MADRFPALTSALFRYRWVYVVPLVLPASKAAAAYWAVRRRRRRRRARHEERVAAIAAEVRARAAAGGLCTARKDWQSVGSPPAASYKAGRQQVRVELDEILGVDVERRLLRVEPGVTIGRLTALLNPRGWTLPVVPELEDLTVGGLLLGYGLETSSHRHGTFADVVEAAEVVLGSGEVVRADRAEHADLFHALPWSRGALGLLTALELRIVPAAPWVALTHHRADGPERAAALFTAFACAEDPPEFVEGFVYSPDEAVVVTGELAERPQRGRVNRIGRWYQPWYHEHVRRAPRGVEYVPLRAYYHRHSRGIFWAAELIVPFGNHPLFRWTLGWLMPPKISFLKLLQQAAPRRVRELEARQTVIQDGVLPIRHLPAALRMCHDVYEVYPLWLAPMRMTRTDPPGLAGPGPGAPAGGEMFVDVGIFFSVPGPLRRGEPWDPRVAAHRFETWLREHGGFQAPYAHSTMSRAEYREMFDCTLYDRVRRDYHAHGVFVDACDKLKRP